MEDANRHGRDEDREIQAKGADQEQHGQDRSEVRATPHVAEPFGEASFGAVCPGVWMKLGGTQKHEGDQHRDEGGSVDQKRPARADHGDDHAGDGWADHPRGVERGGVEGDCVVQVFVSDQLRDEGLAHRRIERGRTAEQEGEDVHVPEPDDPGNGQHPQRQGEGAHRRLRGDQQPALIEMVGSKAGPGQQEELRSKL